MVQSVSQEYKPIVIHEVKKERANDFPQCRRKVIKQQGGFIEHLALNMVDKGQKHPTGKETGGELAVKLFFSCFIETTPVFVLFIFR